MTKLEKAKLIVMYTLNLDRPPDKTTPTTWGEVRRISRNPETKVNKMYWDAINKCRGLK